MIFLILLLVLRAVGLKMPGDCNSGQFYDSSQMDCRSCNTNYSMVPAADGFGCTCASNSIRVNVTRCRPCDSTELISEDGTSCVPRRCQRSGGRVVCRKCPSDYIAVTQNFDGSPMKEVTCFKCARGYKARNNKCVKCETCSCNKNEVVVSGKCLSKKYVVERPKYSDNKLHPTALLEVVKLEYFCSQSDVRPCHALATECVKYFYTSDSAGPCRLWLNHNNSSIVGLPKLILNASSNNDEVDLKRGKDTVKIASAEYYSSGAIKFIEDERKIIFTCLPPIVIKLGEEFSHDCVTNVSELISNGAFGKTYEVYLPNGNYKPLPLNILQADSRYVQKGSWPSKKFRRFFLIDNFLSTNINMSTTIYLRKLIFKLRVERKGSGSLGLHITTEVQYATKSPLSQQITTTIIVQHEMPSAGVLWGIQVWGATLSIILSIYALVQWHATVRRGGLQISLLPLLSGSVADGLYFATLFSTLHAHAAEAGNLGITLPLSQTDENLILAAILAVVVLKMTRVVWMNIKQCLCDIFFLDWTEYYPTPQDSEKNDSYFWRSMLLAREWISMQTVRRVNPLATVIITVIVLQILEPWQRHFPKSKGYSWVIGTISYWTAYILLFLISWMRNRIFGAPTARLAKICSGIQFSLLVFQEEYYAHYVHGRIEENGGGIKIPGPLASCRVMCAPQVRNVYKQLADVVNVFSNNESNRVLLSRFLAAFFERALDGLNWVAIERTTLERLFDAEFTNRGDNTSRLLYDLENRTPSCFALTWWGEEWTLATFDAMIFGTILLITGHTLMAALSTLITWQILQQFREIFASRNLQNKTNVQVV